MCPRPMLELRGRHTQAQRPRQRCTASPESSDEEDDIGGVTITLQPMMEQDQPPTTDDESDDESAEELEAPAPRRSTRTTAGQHSNLYNLPRSALQH